ncbi:MAG TPA: type II toxin-antitoxin system VapC family toxin [Chloroflexota bacterium]|jgi:predicted nucleic acid-binding protein|nr:type II toxin-antitoxin system VapC family toxin [Chloroflexota bacterium]
MTYLVDTDWIIDHLNGDQAATNLLTSLSASGIAISIITYSEVYEGILRSADPRRSEQVFRTFLHSVAILPISRTVAKRNAAVRLDLRRRSRTVRVRGLDLLIAATALTYNLTLVTRNKDDYKDVTGLSLH